MRIIFLLLALSVPLTAQSSPILQVLNQQQGLTGTVTICKPSCQATGTLRR